MLQEPVDGFSVSASRKRPARAVCGFALAVMLASLVATDYLVIVSSAFAGQDIMSTGVAERSNSKSIFGFKDTIVSCKPGYILSPTGSFFANECKYDVKSTNTQIPSMGGVGGFSMPGMLGIGAAVVVFSVLISSGDDTTGTTGTTGTQ